jgi:hypothetical protein
MIQETGFGQAKQKNCSNCGASFTCGASVGNEACWCNDLPHVSPVAAKDDDCLCPRCLTEAIMKLSRGQNAVAEPLSEAINEPVQVADGDGTISSSGKA